MQFISWVRASYSISSNIKYKDDLNLIWFYVGGKSRWKPSMGNKLMILYLISASSIGKFTNLSHVFWTYKTHILCQDSISIHFPCKLDINVQSKSHSYLISSSINLQPYWFSWSIYITHWIIRNNEIEYILKGLQLWHKLFVQRS